MKPRIFQTLILFLFFIIPFSVTATDYLRECWSQQVEPLGEKYLKISYEENLQKLNHNFSLWGKNVYTGRGQIWCNANNFLLDSQLIDIDDKSYQSKAQMTQEDLLLLDYNEENLSDVSSDLFLKYIYEKARYNPAYLIHYFLLNEDKLTINDESAKVIYRLRIGNAVVSLSITKTTNLLEDIDVLEYEVDDFGTSMGDVASKILYHNYNKIVNSSLFYPQSIIMEKVNGKLVDEVKILEVQLVENIPQLLIRPDNYQMKASYEDKPVLEIEKYNNHISLIKLRHESTYAMVVEFRDFLVVIEAPKSSSNGELIIEEAKKVSGTKPIKYFIAGHFHPHYLGGVRAFIHKGATVLSIAENYEYIKYLSEAPYTLLPDSLQMEPKLLQFESVDKDQVRVITDGEYEMNVCFIGEKSAHTYDYLVFYFPKEKLLFEGDLLWLPLEGTKKQANNREKGLYKAIKDLNVEVDEIIQSWPTDGYNVKSKVKFQDLKDLIESSAQ